MSNEKRNALQARIKTNFDAIANSKSPYPDSGVVCQYKRDIQALCEMGECPETINFAMELMNKLCDMVRKDDCVQLAFLQNYTYECFHMSKTLKTER